MASQKTEVGLAGRMIAMSDLTVENKPVPMQEPPSPGLDLLPELHHREYATKFIARYEQLENLPPP